MSGKPDLDLRPNHLPKPTAKERNAAAVKEGRFEQVPRSGRYELREFKRRYSGRSRAPKGVLPRKPRLGIDPRPPLPPAVARWAAEWVRQWR